MESSLYFSFISNQIKSVERHLSGYKKDCDTEHLHDLRVCIKKIRAILSFTENIFTEKCESDSLKLLFKKAGEIRELQINIAMLNLLPNPPERLVVQLRRKENNFQKYFTKAIPKYLLHVRKFRDEIVLSFPLPDKKSVKNYFNRTKKKATKRFNRQERKKMHRCRKLLKKMIFVHEFLPDEMRKITGIKKGMISKIQKEIGIWHDTYATITFLASVNFKKKDEYISMLKQKESILFDNLSKGNSNLKL